MEAHLSHKGDTDGYSSHVADVVCHGVGGYPAITQHFTEWMQTGYSSIPGIAISISWVFSQVQAQLVWERMCPQSGGKLQQLSRLNEVGPVHGHSSM